MTAQRAETGLPVVEIETPSRVLGQASGPLGEPLGASVACCLLKAGIKAGAVDKPSVSVWIADGRLEHWRGPSPRGCDAGARFTGAEGMGSTERAEQTGERWDCCLRWLYPVVGRGYYYDRVAAAHQRKRGGAAGGTAADDGDIKLH